MNVLELESATASLIVVDVQEKLLQAMAAGAQQRVTQNVSVLAAAARRFHMPIFVTEQYPKGLGATAPQVKEALAETLAMNPPFEKLEFDATENEHVANALANAAPPAQRHSVILVGMEAHICVYQTARGLLKRGYHVHVVADATCSRTDANLEIARGLWQRAGAVVTSTETVIFDLLGKAGGDDFKALSRLIK